MMVYYVLWLWAYDLGWRLSKSGRWARERRLGFRV